jgi:hypothetical protein
MCLVRRTAMRQSAGAMPLAHRERPASNNSDDERARRVVAWRGRLGGFAGQSARPLGQVLELRSRGGVGVGASHAMRRSIRNRTG